MDSDAGSVDIVRGKSRYSACVLRKTALQRPRPDQLFLTLRHRTEPMRKLILCFSLLFLSAGFAIAQSRIEAGIFLDSLDISQTSTDNVGLGARFGYRVHSHVMLEAELAYDYGLNFREAFRDVTNGDIVAVEHTSIGVTHGLVGPMLQPVHGHLRPFATLKAGFIDFRLSSSLLPYSTVVSSVLGLRTSNVNAALYPAGGVEASIGPVGLRFEMGDEMYFNRGAHNNLRITFGPILRF